MTNKDFFDIMLIDVYEFTGEFRKIDIYKHEIILNNDSVIYGYCELLQQSLDYYISLEK